MTKKNNEENYFIKNYNMDVTDLCDQKGIDPKTRKPILFLSWDKTYKFIKEKDINFQFEYIRDEKNRPYFTDKELVWAEIKVTMNNISHTEIYPFMNGFAPVTYSSLTTSSLNKYLKRGLCKAIALHGIALHLWTGEDLIDVPTETQSITGNTETPSITGNVELEKKYQSEKDLLIEIIKKEISHEESDSKEAIKKITLNRESTLSTVATRFEEFEQAPDNYKRRFNYINSTLADIKNRGEALRKHREECRKNG